MTKCALPAGKGEMSQTYLGDLSNHRGAVHEEEKRRREERLKDLSNRRKEKDGHDS
jgi:hypothetical protein